MLNFSSCKVVTSRYFLLKTFINNFQVIGACNWSYKKDWNRKLSTEWENKCKQRNVGSRMKRQFSLGGNGMLHLPNGIRKIFKLHYWTKTSMKYKKKWSRSLSGTALSVWGWNLRGESGYFQIWVRFLTRPFYSIFTQMISTKFSAGSWRALAFKLGERQEVTGFWKICLRCCIVEQKEKIS